MYTIVIYVSIHIKDHKYSMYPQTYFGLWWTRFLGFSCLRRTLVSSTNLSQRCFHLFNVPFECKINSSIMITAPITPIVMPAIVPGGVGGGSVGSAN